MKKFTKIFVRFSGLIVFAVALTPLIAAAQIENVGMVRVEGGCFQMGDIFGDGKYDESPVHEVCLNTFAIGKYEVTQGLWQKVMGDNPVNSSRGRGDNYPIQQVTWEDVQVFIDKLNGQTGMNYRLPTEAEWEYACRSGGKREKYCGGEDVNNLAWYGESKVASAHPVGTKAPNGLGIYDMSGNVSEWVQDWYLGAKPDFFRRKTGGNYYNESPRDNPAGPNAGILRAARGGNWNCDWFSVRSTVRGGIKPTGKSWLGFRLASAVN